jgi:chromosomal replication initiator protein
VLLEALVARSFTPTPTHMSPDDILATTCRYFSVQADDVHGRSRTQKISVPRKLACYFIRQMLPMSFEDIGNWLGMRDHSTIIYYIRDIEAKLPDDPILRTYHDEIQVALMQRQPFEEVGERHV